MSRESPGYAGGAPSGAVSTRAVSTGATAIILYPTLSAGAREARIDICDPVRGRERAAVVLRSVNMKELSELVALPQTAAAAKAQRQFALQMCFGGPR